MHGWSSRKTPRHLALAASLFAAGPAAALDSRPHPDAGRHAEDGAGSRQVCCQRACLGNQRKSWLESAIVHADTGGSSVTVLLKLRSKHALHGLTIYAEDGDGPSRRRPVARRLRRRPTSARLRTTISTARFSGPSRRGSATLFAATGDFAEGMKAFRRSCAARRNRA